MSIMPFSSSHPLLSISLVFCFLLSFFLFLHHFFVRIFETFSKSSITSLSHYYGPKMHPIVGCLISFHQNRRRLLDWYTSLLADSPTMTIVLSRLGARRTIVTADPANVEHILKSNFQNYPKGRPFTDLLGDFLGSGIFNADGELWLSQRKLASHEFTARSLNDFVVSAVAAETADRLLPILASAGSAAREVDMQDLLKRFAFDTIYRIALGVDPGFLDASLPSSPLADAFETASAICAGRGSAVISSIWRAKRFLRIGSEKRLHEAVNLIRESITSVVRGRRQREEEDEVVNGKDLLSRLISAGHREEVICDMAISFVVAGRDTTSAALTWFFYLMTCHPEAEAAVVDEVRRVSNGKERLDCYSLKEMKVLEACLCETMRLYPPVAWDSKHAAGDDVLPDGTRVGAGDRVTFFPYGMGRMERLWGEKWMVFDYRRWLTAEGEVARVSPFKFAVFQAGPRVCLGKDMAFMQMKYIAAAVLGKFRMRRTAGGAAPVFVPRLTAHMAGGLKVVVEEREGGSESLNS